MMAFDRTNLARMALDMAQDVRRQNNQPLLAPVCIYDLVSKMGIDVWFKALSSLEGMYSKTPKACIIIGSERPAGRRSYTCAHELGHHLFGHGTRVDELRDNLTESCSIDPEEFLVDAFAGFLLMPKLAVQKAFTDRGWKSSNPSAENIYRVANLFGVGFETLIKHMLSSIRVLPPETAEMLLTTKIKNVRASLVGSDEAIQPLVVVDRLWQGTAVDLEIGDRVIMPEGTACDGVGLRMIKDVPHGRLWEAVAPGIYRVFASSGDWAIYARISRKHFAGRSQFRHLPETPDDE